MMGCPYVENSQVVSCFKNCRAERLNGHWKVCVGSQFDPLRFARAKVEANATGLNDADGNELFEVYQLGEYWGSCYAATEEEACQKAALGDFVETN